MNLNLRATIIFATFAALAVGSSRAQTSSAEITLPEVLAVELPAGASTLNPDDPSLRQLLAGAHSGSRKMTWDLSRKLGVGPARVTFSAWDGIPGQGKPAATRTVRLFVFPFGMTPAGVSGDENATSGNNAVHIDRDASGCVHIVWQDGGREGGRTGPVYRRVATGPNGAVRFETDPIYFADSGPSDWNAYPGLAVRGRDVQLVWQGSGTAWTRRLSFGPEGWTMGPVINTGARSGGRDVGDSIVFDGKGGLHIVTPSGIYAYSVDEGKTWKTEPIPLPANAKIKTQSVTVDAAGIVHVAMSVPITRPDPPGGKLGGYWQLRTIDWTGAGWTNATEVLAAAPGWQEPYNSDDVLADWVRIMADPKGNLHLSWHGTVSSRKYANDAAYYAWRRPGAAWSAPVPLYPPNPARGVKFSYAPSLALADSGVLALVFFDVYNGGQELGFDASLDLLRGGRLAAAPLPITAFVQNAIMAKRPDSAMGPRFPGLAPTVFHAQNGKTWVDVLETMQSPFEPAGPNIIVYQRLELGSWLR